MPHDATRPAAREETLPTWRGALWFAVRARCLQLRRAWRDLLPGAPRRHGPARELAEAPELGLCRSDLWREQGESAERRLELGKVHNLRLALRGFDGIEAPAGAVLSFWKQVGRATRRRGYVDGRELREGCIIPTIGGGLCQLSGALYNAAMEAGLEVVERHRHTQEGVSRMARAGRDATIFWNYVDLRLRAPFPWRLEVRLTADQLVVRIRGHAERPLPRPVEAPPASVGGHSPEACGTCEVEACFRHAPAAAASSVDSVAALVDEFWPEYEAALARLGNPRALLLRPLAGRRWRKANYAWSGAGFARVTSAPVLTLRRALAMRSVQEQGAARQAALLAWDEKLARSFARRLRPEDSHVLVAQNLLPFLWRDGVLGGRSFDVLMTRLPLAQLHAALDAAAARHPESRTCADFRAADSLVALESAALAAARSWVTPHEAIARLAGVKAVRVPWSLPAGRNAAPRPESGRIVYPASTLCRKGAYEVRAAARELGLELVCLGAQLEGPDFWNGVRLATPAADWMGGAAAVVLPAFVEHRPRRLLAAVSRGVPVIASAECGVGGLAGVTTVPAGDARALAEALRAVLGKRCLAG